MTATAQQQVNQALDIFVREAMRLRKAADHAEMAFMRHLYTGEQDEQLWRPLYTSFDELLEKLHICKPSRYRSWVNAQNVVPLHVQDEIGIHGVLAAARIENDQQRNAAISEMVATVRDRGTTLSHEGAQYIRTRYVPSQSNRMKRISETERLRKELNEANRKIRKLEKKNAELQAKLDKYLGDQAEA